MTSESFKVICGHSLSTSLVPFSPSVSIDTPGIPCMYMIVPVPLACWTSYCATFIMASTVFGTTLTTFASSTSFSTPTVGIPCLAALSISEL